MSEKIEKNLESIPKTSDLQVDSVTGFLEGKISPKAKTGFLRLLKTIGNQSIAADKQGHTWSEIAEELVSDPAFNKAYIETLNAMKHSLEGMLYTKAIEKGDTKSAMQWLAAKFPNEYRPNGKRVEKKDGKDKLFDRLLND